LLWKMFAGCVCSPLPDMLFKTWVFARSSLEDES